MKGLFLIFLLMCGHVVTAQDSKAAQTFTGCYELEVEGWRGRLLKYPNLPRWFELEEGSPPRNLDSNVRSKLPLSSWNVKDGKVEIVWSTGLVGWDFQLSASGTDLRDTADSFTDIAPHQPSVVTVVAHSVDCKVLPKRGRLDWLPFSPLFWILVVLFLAWLFAASRLRNKLLRVFLFWIPTLTVSLLFIVIVVLFIYVS